MRVSLPTCLFVLTAMVGASVAYGDMSFAGLPSASPQTDGAIDSAASGPAIDLLRLSGPDLGNVTTPIVSEGLASSSLPGNTAGPTLYGPPPGNSDFTSRLVPPSEVLEAGRSTGNLGYGLGQGITTSRDVPSERGSPVPAPGAAILAAFGLGIVGWVKRRMA